MRSIFSFEKSRISLEQAYFLLLCLVLFSLPLIPIRANNLIIVAAGIAGLWLAYKRHKLRKPFINRPLQLILLLFLLQVAGLVYSSAPLVGLRNIETKLPLIVFPLLAVLTRFALNERAFRMLLWAFVMGVLVTCLIGWGKVVPALFALDFQRALENSHLKFSPFIHTAYLGLYTSFSIVIVLVDARKYPSKRKLKIALIVVLLLSLIFINARTATAGLVLVLFPYVFIQFKKYFWILLVGFIVFMAALLLHPVTQHRFIEAPLKAIRLKGRVDGHDESNWSFSFRYQVYDCALDQIRNRPLVGYGTGGDEPAMLKCYKERQYDMVLDRRLDAHNEYLEGMVRHGIVGLLLYLLVLGVPLFRSFRQDFPEFYLFLLLFAFSGISESLLNVHKGNVFFGFFYSLLSCRLDEQPKKSASE
ncbi:MAG: O-antigen ligase family protein [Bacteroidota bacterium]|jgi:O-antigen ligase|nr:MAG: hypothetical protein DIU61_01915 [Bacteroidota bacterium]